MPISIPAFCPVCGSAYPSGIAAESGVKIDWVGAHSRCPNCGYLEGEVLSGQFEVVGDVIRVISASGLDRARLRRLAATLEEARRGAMSESQTIDAIERDAPSLRALVQHLPPRMRRFLIAFLLAVVQILLAQGIAELRDDSATHEDVRRAVHAAIYKVEREGMALRER